MFGKVVLHVVAAAAVFLGCASDVSALPWWKTDQVWAYGGRPTLRTLPRDGTWPPDGPCPTQDCVVVRELLERVSVIEQALRVPTMGVAETVYPPWLTRELSAPHVQRELRRKVFAYKRRFPAWCARLRRFAAAYAGPGETREDVLFMRDLLALAELIDRPRDRGCLSGMLSALPVSDPDPVDSAEHLCSSMQWSARSCRRIASPSAASRDGKPP